MDHPVLAPGKVVIERGTAVRIMYPFSLHPGGMLNGTADGKPDSIGRFYVTLSDGSRRLVSTNEVIAF